MKAYQEERPDLTEEEIVEEMFLDGNCEVIDTMPTDWSNEVVDEVRKCNNMEDEENV